MTQLTIDLQEGFDQDRVIVRVNGAEVCVKDEVTTRRVLGLAESCEAEVRGAEATVEVELPHRDLRASASLHLDGPMWLGVRVEDDRVELKPSDEPFAYL